MDGPTSKTVASEIPQADPDAIQGVAVDFALAVAIVIGMPLAVMMLNRVPEVMALRGETELLVRNWNGHTVVTKVPQYNILLRALYFILVGWWASALWLELAYGLCMTIIGLPLGFWMFDRTPAVVSLRR